MNPIILIAINFITLGITNRNTSQNLNHTVFICGLCSRNTLTDSKNSVVKELVMHERFLVFYFKSSCLFFFNIVNLCIHFKSRHFPCNHITSEVGGDLQR